MVKMELFSIINEFKPKFQARSVNKMAENHGKTVLRYRISL